MVTLSHLQLQASNLSYKTKTLPVRYCHTSSSVSLFLIDAKLELISSDKTPCGKSSVNYNVTLAKGAKAGTYYKMATVDKMDDCIGHCCGSKRCDVAFMVNKNCYLVKCHDSDSCELKRSENPKFDTMLSMVSKTKGKTIQGKRQYVQHITSGTSLLCSFHWPIITLELPGRFCDTRISSNDYDHTGPTNLVIITLIKAALLFYDKVEATRTVYLIELKTVIKQSFKLDSGFQSKFIRPSVRTSYRYGVNQCA